MLLFTIPSAPLSGWLAAVMLAHNCDLYVAHLVAHINSIHSTRWYVCNTRWGGKCGRWLNLLQERSSSTNKEMILLTRYCWFYRWFYSVVRLILMCISVRDFHWFLWIVMMTITMILMISCSHNNVFLYRNYTITCIPSSLDCHIHFHGSLADLCGSWEE